RHPYCDRDFYSRQAFIDHCNTYHRARQVRIVGYSSGSAYYDDCRDRGYYNDNLRTYDRDDGYYDGDWDNRDRNCRDDRDRRDYRDYRDYRDRHYRNGDDDDQGDDDDD